MTFPAGSVSGDSVTIPLTMLPDTVAEGASGGRHGLHGARVSQRRPAALSGLREQRPGDEEPCRAHPLPFGRMVRVVPQPRGGHAVRVFEVFLKKSGRDEFRHAGALEAPDSEMALTYARETYDRRGEGAQLWLVDRTNIVVADEYELAVNADKPHRHNDGSLVAARHKTRRDGGEE